MTDRQPYVLFPSEDAILTEELPKNAAIIAIDGTWRQEKFKLTQNNDYGLFQEYDSSDKILNNFRTVTFNFLEQC